MQFTLLTKDDIEVIEESGSHYDLPEDLYVDTGGGRLVLTMKGIQYLEYAGRFWKLSLKVSDIKTKRDLDYFDCLLKDAVCASLFKRARSGGPEAAPANWLGRTVAKLLGRPVRSNVLPFKRAAHD